MIKKAKGSKTYIVSVLKAGWMSYPEFGFKIYLTEQTTNKLTQQLQGLKPILEHFDTKSEFYTKKGQNQIIGVCVKNYNINEPFVINNKKFRYEDYSACEIIVDDIEAINKIDKMNYRPSIHFVYETLPINEVKNNIDYLIYPNGKKYQLKDLVVENIAFVSNPRYETQVKLAQDNLTDEDKSIINPMLRSQVVNNNYQYNCINSKCMFGNRNIKNSAEDKMAILEMKLDKILSYIEKDMQEDAQEESINEEPKLEEVASEPSIEEEKKEEVMNQEETKTEETMNGDYVKEDEVKNQVAMSKEELAKFIQDSVEKYLNTKEVKNMCGEKKEVMNENTTKEILNSKASMPTKKPVAISTNANPVKEAVMQTPNHSKENKPKTLGGFFI